MLRSKYEITISRAFVHVYGPLKSRPLTQDVYSTREQVLVTPEEICCHTRHEQPFIRGLEWPADNCSIQYCCKHYMKYNELLQFRMDLPILISRCVIDIIVEIMYEPTVKPENHNK